MQKNQNDVASKINSNVDVTVKNIAKSCDVYYLKNHKKNVNKAMQPSGLSKFNKGNSILDLSDKELEKLEWLLNRLENL